MLKKVKSFSNMNISMHLYLYIYNDTWRNLHHIPYRPETPRSARGPKARGLILVDNLFKSSLGFQRCFDYILEFMICFYFHVNFTRLFGVFHLKTGVFTTLKRILVSNVIKGVIKDIKM